PGARGAFRGVGQGVGAAGDLSGVVSAEETPADGETRVRVECAEGADVAEEIFRVAVSKGWVLRELTREAVSLEDVFVRLTHHEETEAAPAERAAEGEMPPPGGTEAGAPGQSSSGPAA